MKRVDEVPLHVVSGPGELPPWMSGVLEQEDDEENDFNQEERWIYGGTWEVGLTGNQVERLGKLGIEFLPELVQFASSGTVSIKEPSFVPVERVGKQKTWGYQLGSTIQMSEIPVLEKDTPTLVKQLFELVKKVGIRVNLAILADQETPCGVRFEPSTSMPVDVILKGLWALFGKEFVTSKAQESGWEMTELKSWQEGVNFALQQALTKGTGLESTLNWRMKLDKITIPRLPSVSGPDGVNVSIISDFVKDNTWLDWLQKNAKPEQVSDNTLYELSLSESKWLKKDGLSDIGVVLDKDKILAEMRQNEPGDKLARIKAEHRNSLQDWFDHDEQVIIRGWRSHHGSDDGRTDAEILKEYYQKNPIQDETLEHDLSLWLATNGKLSDDRTAIHEFLVERGVVEGQIDDCIDFITGQASYLKSRVEEAERDEQLMAKAADLVERVLSYPDIGREVIPKLIRSIVNSGLGGRDLAEVSLLEAGKVKVRIR